MNAQAPIRSPGDAEHCRHLWICVLKEGLRCALGRIVAPPARHLPVERERLQRQAHLWIGSPDFRHVCEFAGFDAAKVNIWYWREANSDNPGADLTSQAML